MAEPQEDRDEIFEATCPICGAPMEPESCWACDGDGGFHDCGEDTCACADPDEITDVCEACDGDGEYPVCTALPHKGQPHA